jgi:hypothetical protein
MKEFFDKGLTFVKDTINGLPVFSSREQSGRYRGVEYDEKHYFFIPYYLSEYNFAIHAMRCLPVGVPDVNTLPKRRVFHFPNNHSENELKEYMHGSTKELVLESNKNELNTLETLANDIDALDKKLTYGMLAVGGIAAVFNPLVGAGIAAKALLPGFASIVNKFGLRPAGKKLGQLKLDKDVKEAQDSITKDFEHSSTLRVINPILQELELALRTNEEEHDPLVDPNLAVGSILEIEHERWRLLTEKAICHVYQEAFYNSKLHQKARLGPEDIRWLNTMFLNK